MNLDAAGVGSPHHEVGGAHPDVQRSGKAPPAQDSDMLANAKPKGGQSAAKLGSRMHGKDGPGFPGAQGVERAWVRHIH